MGEVETWTSKRSRHVLYASYGSNLCRERFMCYISGGTIPGAQRTHTGARDTTPPVADVGLLIHHRMFFARESGVWGGAVAFIDPICNGNNGMATPIDTEDSNNATAVFRVFEDGYEVQTEIACKVTKNNLASSSTTSAQKDLEIASGRYWDSAAHQGCDDQDVCLNHTFLRAYLISLDQYNDVVKQENNDKAMPISESKLDELIANGPGSTMVVSDGWYGTLLYLGSIQVPRSNNNLECNAVSTEGMGVASAQSGSAPKESLIPVLTFTCTEDAAYQDLAPPSAAYFDVIRRGLIECGWPETNATNYIEMRGNPATHETFIE